MSGGDITLEVPRDREYPFPVGGVRASDREDLMRQFPNGLPADLFADTRGRGLGVTDTRPVWVYSYGPDVNERQAEKMGDAYVPECLYDPTNGTVSRGDLTLPIPLR